jgi:hypothetical protein
LEAFAERPPLVVDGDYKVIADNRDAATSQNEQANSEVSAERAVE